VVLPEVGIKVGPILEGLKADLALVPHFPFTLPLYHPLVLSTLERLLHPLKVSFLSPSLLTLCQMPPDPTDGMLEPLIAVEAGQGGLGKHGDGGDVGDGVGVGGEVLDKGLQAGGGLVAALLVAPVEAPLHPGVVLA